MNQENTQIPKEWKSKKISDFADFYSGGTPSTIVSEYWGGDVPWIRSGELRDDVLNTSEKMITKKGLDESSAKIWPKNTVLIAITGANIGKTSFLNFEASGNQSIVGILPSTQVIPKFLWYYLQFSYKYFWSKTVGGAQPHINGKIVSDREIVYPKIEIQKKIVQKLDFILRQFEKKKKQILSLIEQNKERINLFEKNWLTYIIDNEIEKHPKRKEWKIIKLEEISELITKGSSPTWQGIRYVDHGILFVTSQNVGNRRLILRKKKYVENKFNEIQKRSILKKGDLLTNIVGAGIGRSALFDLDEPANINQAVALIRLNNNIEKKFILYVLNSTQIIKFMHGNKVESARPNLSLAQVNNFPIPLPSIGIQKQIVQNIKNAEEQFKSHKTQFEKIKENDELRINHIHRFQSSILNIAFSGKLLI